VSLGIPYTNPAAQRERRILGDRHLAIVRDQGAFLGIEVVPLPK
jgi:hypothetical protein